MGRSTRLVMLGTGNAVATECYNTCFVLDDGERQLLVDGGGGSGILRQLKLAGFDPCALREMFVTHRHLDHIIGVVWMLRMWSQAMTKGLMAGSATVYAHDEVCSILMTMAHMLLAEQDAAMVGGRIRLVELADGVPEQVMGRVLVPFDIRSTKARQFGFKLELEPGRWLVCCGDEPLPRELYPLAEGCDWLLHEAFCCEGEVPKELLDRMHHSSVTDACRTARELGAHGLVLYHARDAELARRQELYLDEGRRFFSGNLYAPYDLDVIDLRTCRELRD